MPRTIRPSRFKWESASETKRALGRAVGDAARKRFAISASLISGDNRQARMKATAVERLMPA